MKYYIHLTLVNELYTLYTTENFFHDIQSLKKFVFSRPSGK
jgi:hypothetical protein